MTESIPARDGERVVNIDGDQFAAVRVVRNIVGGTIHYHATARAIGPDGSPTLDAAGNPVAREIRHQSRKVGEVEAITADCERAVLGEPTEMVPPWSDTFLQDASIRVALALAPFAG